VSESAAIKITPNEKAKAEKIIIVFISYRLNKNGEEHKLFIGCL